jgi:hypothetical protein
MDIDSLRTSKNTIKPPQKVRRTVSDLVISNSLSVPCPVQNDPEPIVYASQEQFLPYLNTNDAIKRISSETVHPLHYID